MSLSLLLLLLLVCSAQATDFYGTVMTYYPKNTNADGSMTVVLRYKLNFHDCKDTTSWFCTSGNCGNESITSHVVDTEDSRVFTTTSTTPTTTTTPPTTTVPPSMTTTAPMTTTEATTTQTIVPSTTTQLTTTNTTTPTTTTTIVQSGNGEWCQTEGIMIRQVPSNALFQLDLRGGDWVANIDGIGQSGAGTLVELRNRSDTGKANTSPQTTILPALRVPSNCQRDYNLLAFDPDGDEVRCYALCYNYNYDYYNCTPPSVLSLSSSCTLSFSPTSSSNEGAYIVQLLMVDFLRQDINLTETDGSQEARNTSSSISAIPVQFVLRVDPAVTSCTEGLYLPKFLPPTPTNRARLWTPANQTLEISIKAEANISTITELLFSGPYNTNQINSGVGQYILRWTPSENEDGESHPICFVIQAVFNITKYHSELRCVIVSVGNAPTITTTIDPTTPVATTVITTTTTPATTTIPSTTTTPQVTTTTPPTTTTTPSTTTTPQVTTTTPQTTSTTSPTTTAPPITTTSPSTTTTPQVTTTTPPITTTSPSTTTTPQTTTTTPPITTTSPSITTTPPTTTTTPSTTTTAASLPPGPTPNPTTPVTKALNQIVAALKIRISSTSPLSEDDIRNTVIQQIKDELVRRGQPSDITLRLVSYVQL